MRGREELKSAPAKDMWERGGGKRIQIDKSHEYVGERGWTGKSDKAQLDVGGGTKSNNRKRTCVVREEE